MIVDLYRYFSPKGLPYIGRPNPAGVTETQGYNNTPTSVRSNYGKADILGRPIFQPLTIGGMYIPNAIITITSKKNIVSTAVTGRNYTIKELVNTDDYQINVKGVFISEDGTYPAEAVETLNNLYLQSLNLNIDNEICNTLGIDKVVFTSLSFLESRNVNTAVFQFNLLSDYDYEIELLNE